MDKSVLRKDAKKLLRQITPEKKEAIQLSMYDHLFASSLWKLSKTIGVTVSRGFEWSTEKIIHKGWEADKTIVVPKCTAATRQMCFYEFNSYKQLQSVYYGLQEPDPTQTNAVEKEHIDLLIVPGLLFNHEGYRIGFGGGYYDRYLQGFDGETVMIASELQRNPTIPVEPFDQKVNYILTEKGLNRTKNQLA